MQEQQRNDTSLDFLWILAILIGIAALIWYFGKNQISNFIFFLRFYELKVMYGITWCCSKISNWFVPYLAELNRAIEYTRQNLGGSVSFQDLTALSVVTGKYLRYPLILIMCGLAWWLFGYGGANRFRHVYSTKLFRKLEQQNWPQITPIVDLDLVKTDIGKGDWAMALSPMDFCKQHDLLEVTKTTRGYKATLRRTAASQILALQLGPKWQGVNALTRHMQALFAVFIARIDDDKDGAERLLKQLALSAHGNINDNTLDFSGVNELIAKHISNREVKKICSRHAYVTTLFASLLVAARNTGVLASADFLWLKPCDRRMWYLLNSVGRQTAVAEICGAFAHWLAECRVKAPLMSPMVEEGIKGLEIALSEMIYQPEEED